MLRPNVHAPLFCISETVATYIKTKAICMIYSSLEDRKVLGESVTWYNEQLELDRSELDF